MTERKAKQTATLEFECDLPDAPEKVWRALTVPDCWPPG